MPFRPAVGDRVHINGVVYTVPAHPHSSKYPFAQEGGRATVYRLDTATGPRALKVFKPAYQTPQVAESASRMETIATIDGLSVCERTVLRPHETTHNPADEPDLHWAVLMPWVEGSTWYDIITDTTAPERIDSTTLRTLVMRFLTVLLDLERNGVTHCDLSPGNILVRLRPPEIDLIDVEEICAVGMPFPENLPRGTPGYSHASAADGLWHPFADRFAGGLLLCEMIAWGYPRARAHFYGDSFFDPAELQTLCTRAVVMAETLNEAGGPALRATFERLWAAETHTDAPAFWEWSAALQTYFRKVTPSVAPAHTVIERQLTYTISLYQQRIAAPTPLDDVTDLRRILEWLEAQFHQTNAASDTQPSTPARVQAYIAPARPTVDTPPSSQRASIPPPLPTPPRQSTPAAPELHPNASFVQTTSERPASAAQPAFTASTATEHRTDARNNNAVPLDITVMLLNIAACWFVTHFVIGVLALFRIF